MPKKYKFYLTFQPSLPKKQKKEKHMCPKCGSHQVVKIGDNHSGLIFSSGKQAETYYQCKNCYHKWIEHR